MKEYSDVIDDDDDTQHEMTNGTHKPVNFKDSAADADSSGELLEKYNQQKQK